VRFDVELVGVPIGIAELEVASRAVGIFAPSASYFPEQGIFRDGGNALWDLFNRPGQSARGRRWRAQRVKTMQRRAQSLALRTQSGIGLATVRLFLFDSARIPGPPIVIAHFDEAAAAIVAEVVPPAVRTTGTRPAA
jgi:hypothetical protein